MDANWNSWFHMRLYFRIVCAFALLMQTRQHFTSLRLMGQKSLSNKSPLRKYTLYESLEICIEHNGRWVEVLFIDFIIRTTKDILLIFSSPENWTRAPSASIKHSHENDFYYKNFLFRGKHARGSHWHACHKGQSFAFSISSCYYLDRCLPSLMRTLAY